MQVELEMNAAGGSWRWTPAVRAILNGGWTGRDMAAVRAHVEEMRALGVPAPTEVPIVFPVARAMLTQGDRVEIYSPQSSGEVEYVLVATRERVAVTVVPVLAFVSLYLKVIVEVPVVTVALVMTVTPSGW